MSHFDLSSLSKNTKVDFSVLHSGEDPLSSRLKDLSVLGYNVVCIQTSVASNLTYNKKNERGNSKNKKLLTVIAPNPDPKTDDFQVASMSLDSETDSPPCKKNKLDHSSKRENLILRRVQIELSSSDDYFKTRAHPKNNPFLSQYDVIGVEPVNQTTMHQACTTLNCDIITVSYQEEIKNYLVPKRHSIKAAKDRGIFFEFNYGQVLEDRQKFLPKFTQAMYSMLAHTAHCGNLKSVTPNIVLSSSTGKNKFIRSCKDLINFLQIFEIDEAKANTIIGIVIEVIEFVFYFVVIVQKN